MLKIILRPGEDIAWKTADEIFSVSGKIKSNFDNNCKVGLGDKNYEIYLQKRFVVFQRGGNFDKLFFSRVKMSGVCCEVIAAYNVFVMSGVDIDFFKLTAEFEYNAILMPPVIRFITKRGTWGSDPYIVRHCFERYGISFECFDVFKDKDAVSGFKKAITSARCAFVSYTWKWDRVSIKGRKIGPGIIKGIHSFMIVSEKDGSIRAFNRYSNHKSSVRYNSFEEILDDEESEFLVAYVIY